jgi:hypothetical protein
MPAAVRALTEGVDKHRMRGGEAGIKVRRALGQQAAR